MTKNVSNRTKLFLGMLVIALGIVAWLLFDLFHIENQAMSIKVTVETEDSYMELDGNLAIIPHMEELIYVLEIGEHEIYFKDGCIYLENGRGYRMGTGSIDTGISTLGFALKRLSSKEITVSGTIQLADAAKPLKITATLGDFKEIKEGEYVLPSVIRTAMEEDAAREFPILGQDLIRLYMAWDNFEKQENLDGTVSLEASCGLINFRYTLPWEKDGIQSPVSAPVTNPEELPEILDIIYTVCMEGEFSCRQEGEVYQYTLKLDESATKKIATMIAPEIVTYVLDLNQGELKLDVENERITKAAVHIDGEVKILLLKVDAAFGVTFEFK